MSLNDRLHGRESSDPQAPKASAENPTVDFEMDLDEPDPTPAAATPAPEGTTTAKPRPVSFFIQRALLRYLSPELRDFAVACAAGRAQPTDVLPDLTHKLAIVAENVSRHGPVKNVAEIENIVPVPSTSQYTRLSADVVQKILDMRRSGHSRRSIGKELKRPATTIHNVLEREGDPAPSDVLKKEAEVAQRTVARLQAKIDAIKSL